MSPAFVNYTISDTRALKDVIDEYDLISDQDFPNGQPFEYFAVLALCHVVEGHCYFRRSLDQVVVEIDGPLPQPQTEVEQREREEYFNPAIFQWSATGQHALEALEAVCWAERLHDCVRFPATQMTCSNAHDRISKGQRINSPKV